MPLVDGVVRDLELPRKHARVLFDNSREWFIRCLRGGRAGAKDWSMTAAAVELAVRYTKRFLFTREIQNTIKDSAHQLIRDTIVRLGYSEYFEQTQNEIRCIKTGATFWFRGLRDLNVDNIKSIEGVDVCVIGEAQNLTKKSWTTLAPTIRKAGAQIWIQYNEQFDDDFVYELTVNNPPDDLICEQVLFTDNPWCSEQIKRQAARMEREDPTLYKNVWLGQPLGAGGRVFPMYNQAIHEIDFDLRALPNCDLYMSIDPHRKYYPAITWYAVTPSSAVVVYNEWPTFETLGMWYDEARNEKDFDLTLDELANVILANDYTTQYGGQIIGRTGDPRFLAENPDMVTKLMSRGVLGWKDAPFERIETQRENLKSLIRYNPAIPVGGSNMPDWYVRRECRNKSRAYRRHSWSEDKDREAETNKDFIDNDRYFLSTFANGRPLYVERGKPAHTSKLVSMAEVSMRGRPAQGFFG